jgi:acetyl esterase/lipase
MKHRTILLLGAAAALATGIAQAKPGDRLRERRAAAGALADDTAIERSGRADKTGTKVMYGSDAAQRVLVWPAKDHTAGARPPLAVFIHGGGWQKGFPELVDNKPVWFKDHGWAFASIGYRLLPGNPVEEQARDVGRALTKLRVEAAKFGYDPDRILLFGHSAGAHLTALVSSDPQYAGDSFAAIKGAILIDGACYDVPAQIATSAWMAKRTYIPAFGEDPARQRQLSPITHAGGRDVGDWLLLYTSARDDAKAQSEALAAALRRGGTLTELAMVPSTKRNPLAGHLEINKEFGTANYAANPQIEAIMRRVAR